MAMNPCFRTVCTAMLVGLMAVTGGGLARAQEPDGKQPKEARLDLATFAGGCFWCVEAVFQEIKGVHSAVSGYCGGNVPNPSYKEVLSGRTGHVEAIQVTYDPDIVSYAELLEVFWKTHDPTTPNKQGIDVGPQYNSVVFYHNDEQRTLAEQYKQKLIEKRVFRGTIVTQIRPLPEFYLAEQYHQDYFLLNKQQSYCRQIIRPKLSKLKRLFSEKLKRPPTKIRRTDAEWKEQLTELQYKVTRQEGTENPFSGEYLDNYDLGIYRCLCCDLPLFSSDAKYRSGKGWPSFWGPLDPVHIQTKTIRGASGVGTEVSCRRCNAHLGSIFNDGPKPTGLRYSINSAALKFQGVSQDP